MLPRAENIYKMPSDDDYPAYVHAHPDEAASEPCAVCNGTRTLEYAHAGWGEIDIYSDPCDACGEITDLVHQHGHQVDQLTQAALDLQAIINRRAARYFASPQEFEAQCAIRREAVR